jgi:hypothetical protein
MADRVAKAKAEVARVEAARVAELKRLEDEKLAALAAVEQKQWDVVATFPPSVLATLPPSVLATLPASILATLPPFSNTIGMSLQWLPGGPNGLFSIGVYEVSQEQYKAVMGTNPSRTERAQNPVDHVSWDDAVEFCLKLSALPAEKAARRVYRLPTQAEWEYACRAGTTTLYSFGDDDRQLADYGWFGGNSDGFQSHPVGQKKPNGWGLYDMHGNVWEWCSDRDKTGFSTLDSRCYARGGGGTLSAEFCRSARWSTWDAQTRDDSIGFRVALSPSGQ